MRTRQSSPRSVLFPYTAMIDVLFLLVVFLVLGSNFEQFDQITLPDSNEGQAASATQSALIIELRADGTAWSGAQQLSASNWRKPLLDAQPTRLILAPDAKTAVQNLLNWHERLVSTGLPLVVQVRRRGR